MLKNPIILKKCFHIVAVKLIYTFGRILAILLQLTILIIIIIK